MKKHLIARMFAVLVLLTSLSLLAATFGIKKRSSVATTTHKPTKTALVANKVVAPKAIKKKIEKPEWEEPEWEEPQDTLPDTEDEYKTAYWIGTLPEALKDSVSTSSLVFVDSTAFGKALPTHIQEVYINADDVPNIGKFVDSPLFQTIVANKTRVVIHNNKNNDKDEQLVKALSGVQAFEGADFMMIGYQAYGRSIIPVGYQENWYKPQRLSIFREARFEREILGSEKTRANARTAEGNQCANWKELWQNGVHAQNRLPGAITEMSKDGSRSYVKGRLACQKLWNARIYTVINTHRVERGQLVSSLCAGCGSVTHREVSSKCTSKTVGNGWSWGLSTTFGKKVGIGINETIKAELSFKVTGSYTQARSRGYTEGVCINNGQTIYSNPCSYACCDSEGSFWILQEDIRVRTVNIGDTFMKYDRYLYLTKSKVYKLKKLKKPVYLRFKWTRTSPYYAQWNEASELFIAFLVDKKEDTDEQRKCRPTSCYSYTSGKCDDKVK